VVVGSGVGASVGAREARKSELASVVKLPVPEATSLPDNVSV